VNSTPPILPVSHGEGIDVELAVPGTGRVGVHDGARGLAVALSGGRKIQYWSQILTDAGGGEADTVRFCWRSRHER
jgi:hypothetical protein